MAMIHTPYERTLYEDDGVEEIKTKGDDYTEREEVKEHETRIEDEKQDSPANAQAIDTPDSFWGALKAAVRALPASMLPDLFWGTVLALYFSYSRTEFWMEILLLVSSHITAGVIVRGTMRWMRGSRERRGDGV